jgi:hypothetical protein
VPRLAAILLALDLLACGRSPAPVVAPPPASPPLQTIALHAPPPPPPIAAAPAAVDAGVSVEPPEEQRRTFVIDDASRQLAFRLTVTHVCAPDELECNTPADLAILRKDRAGQISGAPVQTEHFANVALALDGSGEPLLNATHLYDVQGVLVVGDFDFDGRDDFAVQIGNDGPYSGPNFTVYLDAAGREDAPARFVVSDALSELTLTTPGMFQVDPKRKRLVTFAKGGCCFHETTTYTVAHGAPVAVTTHTEKVQDGEDAGLEVTDSKLVNGHWRSKTVIKPLD